MSGSLHDSALRRFDYSPEANTLELVLDGNDGRGGLRAFRLRYSDLASFRSITDPDNGLPGPSGYGDLGYYEVDVTEDGRLEHRILFSTGVELHIVFEGFSVVYEDLP